MPHDPSTVRLADFIVSDMGAIVAEWEVFAGTLFSPASSMDSPALRDHVEEILQAIVIDLSSHQSPEQQSLKSMGLATPPMQARETAAQTHATLRARSGFNIRQLAAEYRALRASVLRLWSVRHPHTAVSDFGDVIRFNEAIDQALAESIEFFSFQVDQSRNLMLGMLGHDLRSPLQAIQMTALLLGSLNAGEKVSSASERLIRSGARMKALVDDLLDFNRVQLGLGIPITRSKADLRALLVEGVAEVSAAYPGRQILLDAGAEMPGEWDSRRMLQLLSNLIVNALIHGATDTPVIVSLTAERDGARIQVRNRGAVIDAPALDQIFKPLQRGRTRPDGTDEDSGLGLGLFIASEVVKGHGGQIEVRSDQSGTVFAVRVPMSASLSVASYSPPLAVEP
ncbi:MAG: sensor histidine kinase [Pseudomonadota bacterium]